MKDFKIVLVDPMPVTLNLRAAARKFNYGSSKLAEDLGWDNRRVRRFLSGNQEPKPSVLEHFAQLFGIQRHHFLKPHEDFIDYLNVAFPDHNPSYIELKGLFDMEEIQLFDIRIFGFKEEEASLMGHRGYYSSHQNFRGTEADAAAYFEEVCIKLETNGTVVIAQLFKEHRLLQTFNRERYEIMLALLKKTAEVWHKVNPSLEDTIEFRSPLFDRYARILPRKEYELLMLLRAEIFPHLLAKDED